MKLLVTVPDEQAEEVLELLREKLGDDTVTVVDVDSDADASHAPSEDSIVPMPFYSGVEMSMEERTRMQLVLTRAIRKQGKEINGCSMLFWKTASHPYLKEQADYYVGTIDDHFAYYKSLKHDREFQKHAFRGVFFTILEKRGKDDKIRFTTYCLPYELDDPLHAAFVDFVNGLIIDEPKLCLPNAGEVPDNIGALSSKIDTVRLPRTTKGLLQTLDIRSYGEMLCYTSTEFMIFRGFGQTKVEQLKELAHRNGLMFEDENQE